MVFSAAISAPNAIDALSNTSTLGVTDGLKDMGGEAYVREIGKMDIWGNPRIPYLEKLPGYSVEKPFEWVDVPTDEIPIYASLVGIPVRGLPAHVTGNATFEVGAVYVTVNVSVSCVDCVDSKICC